MLPVTIATRKKKAAHASLRTEWAVYNTSGRKRGLFILKVVDHVWLLELSKAPLTHFSDVLTKTMMDKLQEICLGKHNIDILVLQDKMRKMHNKWETIPQSIESLEDAQKQAKRAKTLIGNATLAMNATRPCSPKRDTPSETICGSTSTRSTGRGKSGRPLTSRPTARPS